MNERFKVMLTEHMVGSVFHFAQDGILDIRNSWFRKAEPEPLSLPKIKVPLVWWIVYAGAAVTVWFLWPDSLGLPNDVWIGVLSFEGLLAALLTSVGSAAILQGVVPATMAFWSALDPRIGVAFAEGIRLWREDPTQGTSPSSFKNAFVVAINTLFLLPFVVVLDSRWRASILAASVIWTVRRIVSDVWPFFLPEYATVLPKAYWIARSWHESLAYCPICKSKPQVVNWPPPRQENKQHDTA